MKKLLVLDVGEKRTGYAIGHRGIPVPQKTGVITCTEHIVELIEGCDTVVVGLPVTLSGRFGKAVMRTLDWVSEYLSIHENVEIYLVDERFTSSQSEKLLLASGMKRSKRRVVANAVSAHILYDIFVRGSPRIWKFKRNLELQEIHLEMPESKRGKILVWNVPVMLTNVPKEKCFYFTEDPQIAWKLSKMGCHVYNLVEDIRRIEPFDLAIVDVKEGSPPSVNAGEVYTLDGRVHKDKRSEGS